MGLAARYIGRHLGMYLLAMLFLVVEAASDLLQPAIMSYMVDDGVQCGDMAAIERYGLLMLGVAALGLVGALARNNLSARASQEVGRELRGDLYRTVMGLEFEDLDRLRLSSVVTRLTNDVAVLVDFINSTMRIAVKAPITCIGAIVLVSIQTPQFTGGLLVVVVAVTVVVVANVHWGRPRFARMQRAVDALNDTSREIFSSVRVVKAFGAEFQASARCTGAARRLADAGTSAMGLPAVLTPLVGLAVNLGVVALLWVSQETDPSEIGHLMASVNYMTQMLVSLSLVGTLVSRAARAASSADRIEEVFRAARSAPVPPKAPEASGGSGEAGLSCARACLGSVLSPPAPVSAVPALAFDGVSFSYPSSVCPVLENVCFSVEAGEVLGVIGTTGAGKSTMVALATGLYRTSSGRVLVGGCDIRALDPDTLHRWVCVVPQVSSLFSGTVADNLRWGDAAADNEALWEALRAAAADGFVSELPLGLETPLGQGGVNLSGGQRQRLCLARALLRRPRVLLLDDCTSALDAVTEARVLEAVRSYAAGSAVVLVGQRVATVRRCSAVLCLEAGSVCGLGSHAGLLDGCQAYRAIYESQIGPLGRSRGRA